MLNVQGVNIGIVFGKETDGLIPRLPSRVEYSGRYQLRR